MSYMTDGRQVMNYRMLFLVLVPRMMDVMGEPTQVVAWIIITGYHQLINTALNNHMASEPDPFALFHSRLVQCVVEIRQRAKSLLSTDDMGIYTCDLPFSVFTCFTTRGDRICSYFVFSKWIWGWVHVCY
jgi:hypothetical protein